MKRTTYFLVSVAAAAVIAACGNGEEASPPATSTAVVTLQATPEETLGAESGPLSQEAPTEGAYLIDLAAGRWTRVLPTHQEFPPFAAISPDGETIVYRDENGLVAADIDGADQRRIAEAGIDPWRYPSAAFSPDGETLAIWGASEGAALTLLPWPDGEPLPVELPESVHYAAWSGDVLAVGTGPRGFGDVNAVYFVSPDGRAVQVPNLIPAGYRPFVLAPDQRRLTLWVRAAAGSVVLTLAPGEEPQRLVELPGQGIGGLSWSSDGALLAAVVQRPSQSDPNSSDADVQVIDTATGALRFTVTSAGGAAWSPALPLLLMDNFCGDFQQLLVDADGSDLRPLIADPQRGGLEHPWSPDGRRVATTWEGTVTAIDVESGERETLIRGPQAFNLQWPTADHLVFNTIGAAGFCEDTVRGETRVVFP